MPLAEVFPNTFKPIIGMLHLPPLPGSYNYTGQPLDDIVEHALHEAEILASSGFDGLLMQNAGDRPASLEVCPEKVAYMSVIGAAVRRAHPTMPLGVNVCWNVPKATIAVCHAAGGAFIRLEHVYIGMAITAAWTGLWLRLRGHAISQIARCQAYSDLRRRLRNA